VNPLEKQLNRLLQAAARARPEQPLAAPDRWQAGVVAAWKADRKIPNIVDASMAKVFAAETAQDLASAGMEIVGIEAGAGHHLIEKLFRDAKALNIVEGTGQIQRIIMARSLVGLPR